MAFHALGDDEGAPGARALVVGGLIGIVLSVTNALRPVTSRRATAAWPRYRSLPGNLIFTGFSISSISVSSVRGYSLAVIVIFSVARTFEG